MPYGNLRILNEIKGKLVTINIEFKKIDEFNSKNRFFG